MSLTSFFKFVNNKQGLTLLKLARVYISKSMADSDRNLNKDNLVMMSRKHSDVIMHKTFMTFKSGVTFDENH